MLLPTGFRAGCQPAHPEVNHWPCLKPCIAQYAELVRLPENVPEEVPVTCAGRSAVLNIRSQIVTFGGQRMSASRFETVCGKGDAKKWKCSIWLEGPDGCQEQVRPICLFQQGRPESPCMVYHAISGTRY